MRKSVSLAGVALMALALSQPSDAGATTVTLYSTDGSGTPTGLVKDATIFANNVNNSNGAGPGMFVGTNGNGSPRRALLRFDVRGYSSGVLIGKTIDDVRLKLIVGMKAGSGGGDGMGGGSCGGGDNSPHNILIHRVKDVTSPSSTGDWGESATTSAGPTIGGTGQGAAAGTDDATWESRRHDENPEWASGGGGDYEATASDTQAGGTTCPYLVTFQSAGMIADVTAWTASSNPTPNRGWILINDDEDVNSSFRAFWTKEGELQMYTITIGMTTYPNYGPVLEVDYH